MNRHSIATLMSVIILLSPKQAATGQSGPATPHLAQIVPPVSINSLPIVGEGKERRGDLEVTNNSDKPISRLVIQVALLAKNGSVKKTVPHTTDTSFGQGRSTLGKGQKSVIAVSSFWVKDDVAMVSGAVTGITWEDGSTWPAWSGPAPKRISDSPLSLAVLGVVNRGDGSLPVIGIYNHGTKAVQRLMYRIIALDSKGEELLNKRWGGRSVEAGSGTAMLGYSTLPKGTVNVKLSLIKATFDGSPGAAAHAPLDTEQIAGREKVSGGNWKVSFAEDRHLGFVVIRHLKGQEQERSFHWSDKPSRDHQFHYDHHHTGEAHQLSFSAAGDGSSKMTYRYGDSSFSRSQRLLQTNVQFTQGTRRTGRSLRGPVTMYALHSDGRPTFVLQVVFVKNTTTAEKALNSALDRRYGPVSQTH
jgi:hypothetical protein